MYIDDCVYGTELLTGSEVVDPINIGSSELVTINELVSIVEDIAGIELTREYNLDAPQGVRGRNSDNTLILDRLGWEPDTSLRDGLESTYRWIWDQMANREVAATPDTA
jgi:nucleoside-diphosphate-sugar epimerase